MMVNLSVHIRISFKINHMITRDKLLTLVFDRFAVTIFSLQPYNLYKIFKIVQGFLRVADPSVLSSILKSQSCKLFITLI